MKVSEDKYPIISDHQRSKSRTAQGAMLRQALAAPGELEH